MTKRGFLKSLTAGTLAGIPAVRSIEVIQPKSDEVLFVRVASHLTQQQAEHIREMFRREMPGQKVLVSGPEISIQTIKLNA